MYSINTIKKETPFQIYIQELGYRTIYCLIYSITMFTVIYYYSEDIVYQIAKPLIRSKSSEDYIFIYTNLTEVFYINIYVSIILTIMITFPYVLFQYLIYIKPALFENEKKNIITIFIMSLTGAISYIYLTNIYIIPYICNYFISYENIDNILSIKSTTKLNEYIYLIVDLYYAFIYISQIPILIILLLFNNIINIINMIKLRKYIIIISLVIGATISPPDILSQFIIAIPIVLSFEITLFFYILYVSYLNTRIANI
uniref:Sec-independent protein translocase component TatC n=1 Tax=Meteora sporadica TaxID=2913902 RepID=UPI003001B193|nr:Sec-independent protein translocase component TatC [Meteora sporadica]